ncbi:SGT1 protein-domain-containing protein [Diplogelasinospora grovesii]|uniref:SGT1 protein-domain-containing protein n=1 Tax=Diplogelasinospora grovesii TaxID=303347 RepID=A0AAN6S1E0_9PEZI|nr:SGT1 protein-domain-containing protein [Diplogelasinospora grovesii]
MDSTADELRPGDESFDGFRMSLPENCVEYMLFIIDDKLDPRKALSSLEAVRKAAMQKSEELTKDYIWQREAFKLETKNHKGLFYLHGTTSYGDSVEDEWLIVYLLRELSKSSPNLWIRVFDNDGEFLLIEAAKVVPDWLSPEIDTNRVWINNGQLRIIPLDPKATSKTISLTEALNFIKTSPEKLIHSTFIEAEAFYRLERYPQQIQDSLHHALVTIPRKLAYILHARPKAIAPATEAFYLRDPISLKPLLSPNPTLIFPPVDLVTVSVRFTKVLYAQLKSQRFDPPPIWHPLFQSPDLDGKGDEAVKKLDRLELGMKVTTGFEILAKNSQNSDNRVVREVGILLEDLEEDGDSILPTDDDIRQWPGVGTEDDDSWMNINYADFEAQLDGKPKTTEKGAGGGGFSDAKTQADLQKIGAELNDMDRDDDMDTDGDMDDTDEEEEDGEEDEDMDKEVSFDEEQFARMMREMMGLPSEDKDKSAAAGKGKGKENVVDEMKGGEEEEGDEEGDEDEEIRKLMVQMESELNEHGALVLDPKPDKTKSLKAKGKEKEVPDSKGKGKEIDIGDDDDDEDDEGEEEVDIDYNLAKNLLESFKSQAGMAGPTGNLLNSMTNDGKRKDAPSGGASGQQQKKKKGNSGKWRTPQHEARAAMASESSIQPGDVGIWITCARHQERRAAREAGLLFDEYADKMYGIKPSKDEAESEDGEDDIEAAIQKEVAALKTKPNKNGEQVFTPIRMNVDCLLFFKTKAPPIEPVEFVRRICLDAKEAGPTDPRQTKTRYLNRLTPVTVMGKATEQGIVEVAKAALAPYFELSGKKSTSTEDEPRNETTTSEAPAPTAEQASEQSNGETAEAKVDDSRATDDAPTRAFTFAIRPTIRNHNTLKRDFVINEIAKMISDDRHKVNLKNPDKVILIELYQNVCGMSVVDGGEWEELRKYNITELYNQARKSNPAAAAE